MYINANVCATLITFLNKKKYNVTKTIVILHREIASKRDKTKYIITINSNLNNDEAGKHSNSA